MSISRTLLLALVASPFLSIQALTIKRRDATPALPYDPNTTQYCTWWIDYDGFTECEVMLEENWTNLVDFRRWVSPFLFQISSKLLIPSRTPASARIALA